MVDLAVVIPCYRQAHFLPEAIESILKQTTPPSEIIVIDDGSDDATTEIACDYPVVVIRHPVNRGLSAARNSGIRYTNCHYIIPLDADDILMPSYIEKVYERNGDVVSTWTQCFGDSDETWELTNLEPEYDDFIIQNRITCCALFSKAMWKKLGGYDERLKRGLEDWHFWIKAAEMGYHFTVVPELLFNYRKHKGSMIDKVNEDWESIEMEMRDLL